MRVPTQGGVGRWPLLFQYNVTFFLSQDDYQHHHGHHVGATPSHNIYFIPIFICAFIEDSTVMPAKLSIFILQTKQAPGLRSVRVVHSKASMLHGGKAPPSVLLPPPPVPPPPLPPNLAYLYITFCYFPQGQLLVVNGYQLFSRFWVPTGAANTTTIAFQCTNRCTHTLISAHHPIMCTHTHPNKCTTPLNMCTPSQYMYMHVYTIIPQVCLHILYWK